MAVNALSIDTLDAWLPIPLVFLEGPWRDAGEWSDQVATVLPHGTGRAQFAQALRELQAVVPPLPGAQARMLWLGELERPQLAHVYVSPGADEVDDLTALAGAGLGLFVQTVTRAEVEGYHRAIHAVLAGDEQKPAVSARWIGDQSGMLVVVDLVTFEPGMLAPTAEDLRDLFQAVRLVAAPQD